MTAQPNPHYITEEEYRDGEEISTIKHEWLDGQVYAMAGGTFNHATICGNAFAAAKAALRGKACKARSSELRVKIESNGQEVYPDAVIFCPPSRFVGKGDSTLLTPKVIFEVLSESTEKYDRQRKFVLYQTIETLEEYVLIEQDRIWVDHYRRVGEDWLYRSYNERSSILKLQSVAIEIPLDDIYDELELPESLFGFTPSAQPE
ncbi:Uma2 family endonuclease [bacterium]|nr:MAG: Uma2 family endonuclease [bacterium]